MSDNTSQLQNLIDHRWYVEAITTLTPKRTCWQLTEDNVLTWGGLDPQPEGFVQPSLEEIQAKADELKQLWENTEYQRLRASEYPPVEDYLDGLVKGDLVQQQQYIDACLAIKQKYPKPTV